MERNFFLINKEGRILSIFLALVFVGAVALDQVTKAHAQKSLLVYSDPTNLDFFQGKSYPVGSVGKDSPDTSFWVNLKWQYSRNRGAAFSMLSELRDSVRVPFFYGVTVLAVIVIAFYLRSTPFHHHFTRVGLIMILSGAVGNFLDRLQHGYVIDFVDVDWNILGWQHDFAIFNVADVCINVGLIFILLDMLIHRKEASSK
ncbi:MAG: signal peptidase II [Oligoflexales bacterium]